VSRIRDALDGAAEKVHAATAGIVEPVIAMVFSAVPFGYSSSHRNRFAPGSRVSASGSGSSAAYPH